MTSNSVTGLKVPMLTHTNSEEMTRHLGYQLGLMLTGGSTVALRGDLGSGKTVFARGIAEGLGVNEPVVSPSFNLVQEYYGNEWILYHIDLYRIYNESDALSLGIEDFFDNPRAVIVIEWAERAQNIIENVCYEVYITHEGLKKRKIDIKLANSSWNDNLPTHGSKR